MDPAQVCEVSADFEVKAELDTRFHQLQTRLNTVTAENEEVVFNKHKQFGYQSHCCHI